MNTTRILRRREVEALTGLSASTIYRLIQQSSFPRPGRLSRQAVGWHSTAVHAWIDARKSAPIGRAAR